MDIKSPIMEKPPDISPAVKKIENEREEDVKNEKEKDELLETHDGQRCRLDGNAAPEGMAVWATLPVEAHVAPISSHF